MSMRHKNISDEEIHSRINGIVVDSQGLKGTELVTKLVVQLANEEKGIDSGRILDILDDMERKGDLVIVRYVLASLNLDNIEVDFIIHLEKWDDHKQYERVGIEEEVTEKILGLDIPKSIIPVRDGRNIAVLVESAVTNFNLKQRGINSAKEFEKRVYDFIKNQNEE